MCMYVCVGVCRCVSVCVLEGGLDMKPLTYNS